MQLSTFASRASAVVLWITAFCSGTVAAQSVSFTRDSAPSARRRIDAIDAKVALGARRQGKIRVDGRLDEPAWQNVPLISGFTQSYPSPGASAVDKTEARVLYDDDALYVAIRMYDAHPDSIAAQLSRRDATGIYSDWISVYIDSYLDRRTAFEFAVNPVGVKRDALISNDGDEDVNWDAVWEVATRVDADGWVAEFRIPFAQLRFGSRDANRDREWGLQIIRDIARRNERDSWAPWMPASPGFVSRFGALSGLNSVPAPNRLELLPYVSTKLTRAPGTLSNPFFERSDTKPAVGLDMKFGLPGALTLTATVNPDFGQVEVDPSVVNLTAFETFFPEKRPFFLEGADALTFGQAANYNDVNTPRTFYSRRIGRQPQIQIGGSGVVFVDEPDRTAIATAAKVTGQTGAWTIGILDAVTPEEKARVLLVAGDRSTAGVEPLTNYFVGRVKRTFRNGQTFVGSELTSTIRDLSDTAYKRLLRARATFAGVDFEHDMRSREWVVSGYLGASAVTGSPSAIASTQTASTHYFQRPDASYLHYDRGASSLRGYIGELAVEKNGPWYGSVAYKEESPGLELNDIGFQGRADFKAFSSLVGYQNFTAGNRLRSYGAYAFTNNMWDFGGNSIFVRLTAAATATLMNLSHFAGQLTFFPRYMNNQFTRGGPLALQPSSWNGSLTGGTDSRKIIALSASAARTVDETGSNSTTLSVGADYRATAFIHLVAGPSFTRTYSTAQYVTSVRDVAATATFGSRYVFASLHQSTLALDTRAEWTFTPALSLQLYAQPFVSAGRFSDFKEFLTPRTYAFAVYGSDRGAIAAKGSTITVDPGGPAPSFRFGNPNFNIRNLRGNAIVRWEYRPGSAIFFVWQQQRSDVETIGDFNGARDLNAVFRTIPTNVFVVKATYWIGR